MTPAWNKGLTKKDPRVAKYSPLRTGKIVACLNCGKKHYRPQYKLKRKRWFCGNECFIEWKKKNGWITGYWKSKKMSKTHRENLSKSHLGHKVAKEVKEKLRKKNTLSKHPQWQGGKSFEPYGLVFNENLKEKIRQRDKYRCQECFRHRNELFSRTGKKYKLHIHHIDYNKKNNNEQNLISLCRSCHLQTNFKRGDWTKYLQNKLHNYAIYS